MTKRKKPFFKTTVGKVLVGAADTVTGGVVSNIVETTDTHPAGKVDIAKAIVPAAVALLLIYLVATGKITIEQAQELRELAD